MKIHREGNSFDEISFYLRFTNVTESLKDAVHSELSYLKIDSRRPKRDPISFVLSIDLASPFNVPHLTEIVKKHQISSESYGLYISMRSEFDHGGFRLPEDIANLYHELKGKLDVSFTSFPLLILRI